jgi:tetratricopeptide (TPR) repeat protein
MAAVDVSLREALQKGMKAYQAGRLDEAQSIFQQIMAQDPRQSDAHNFLGLVMQKKGDTKEALRLIGEAIVLHPSFADYHINLGEVLKSIRRYEEALASYRRAMDLGADSHRLFTQMGFVLHELKKDAEAIPFFRRALAKDPSHTKAKIGLGLGLIELQNYAEAETILAESVQELPQDVTAWNNYSIALRAMMKEEEAKIAIEKALAISPSSVPALSNYGEILKDEGDFERAIAVYDKAIALNPDYIIARYNRGLCLLTEGRLAEGWQEFSASRREWLAHLSRVHEELLQLPLWDGSSLQGKRILIWADQGVGDEILFLSMLPDVLATGAAVVVEAQERLVPILKRSFPMIDVYVRREKPDPKLLEEKIDFQAPGIWLGHWLRNDFKKFVGQKPFLQVDSARVATIRERYAAKGFRHIVGLSWRSKAKRIGRFKSSVLQDWEAVLSTPDTIFIDLQYGDTAAELAGVMQEMPGVTIYRDPEIDQMKSIDDFMHQVAACDHIVSVSNTAVHVAGAVGVPVTAMMPKALGSIWYWFTGEGPSVWYPSVHILRPDSSGAWKEVIARAAQRLTHALGQK